MSANSFGTLFKLTSFGESHGKAVGGVIEGVLPNTVIDEDFIQNELDRRRPGQSSITTPRNEEDKVQFLSGIFEGKATGTPIGFVIWNKDQRSNDYGNIADVYRPSHADYTYQSKYGIRDYRGGGRSSARETIARVVAGAIAKLMLQQQGITIQAFTSKVGSIQLSKEYQQLDLANTESNIVRCPDTETANEMITYIDTIRKNKDSVGGVISCVIKNAPVGLGDPVFNKLHATLGQAMLSINAVKGFDYGLGFGATDLLGSQHNDEFYMDGDRVRTKTNRSGGIQGGISNGEDIYFNVAFKPIATILMEQNTVNKDGEEIKSTTHGRHDPCVLPRAVPIVEAMAAMTIADHILVNKMYK
ncbi:chorismate synthase [Carboxylicivirga sp. M1479]|uniref:chorismate synthase n=1 Tax=Carboxylicivirga sp. M1479 TaxID=2594476 RepID=UPI00117851F4|nr:chorismate synthase [Carboxylicivirga sp. M1479]TRX71367.1 chorismate synthase [Carboxylicivirga sp. M1479]